MLGIKYAINITNVEHSFLRLLTLSWLGEGVALNGPNLAKLASMLGMSFEWPQMVDNSYLSIYLKILFASGTTSQNGLEVAKAGQIADGQWLIGLIGQ